MGGRGSTSAQAQKVVTNLSKRYKAKDVREAMERGESVSLLRSDMHTMAGIGSNMKLQVQRSYYATVGTERRPISARAFNELSGEYAWEMSSERPDYRSETTSCVKTTFTPNPGRTLFRREYAQARADSQAASEIVRRRTAELRDLERRAKSERNGYRRQALQQEYEARKRELDKLDGLV